MDNNNQALFGPAIKEPLNAVITKFPYPKKPCIIENDPNKHHYSDFVIRDLLRRHGREYYTKQGRHKDAQIVDILMLTSWVWRIIRRDGGFTYQVENSLEGAELNEA